MKVKSIGVYFENLNAIRFVAAFLVIIHHIEQFKGVFGLPNSIDNKVIQLLGKLGVVLFFVLSGFLISYLLFMEKEVKGTISVKKFYIRRILRIWPLYFLIILCSLFLFPSIDFLTVPELNTNLVSDDLFSKFLLFLFFLPNLVLVLYGAIPFASQTWSIGAEEQFYLIWPILNKKIKNKWLLIFGVILLYLSLKIVLHLIPQSNFILLLNDFLSSMPIDCMAIGGFFALIVFEKTSLTQKIRAVLFSKIVQISTLVITLTFLLKGYSIPFFRNEFYAILFGILICNLACNEKRLFSLENALTNYLGKISYGLYMFHPLLIVITIKLSLSLNSQNDYFIYPVVYILTIIAASLSFEFFEKFFINKKIKYTDVISGDSAKST